MKTSIKITEESIISAVLQYRDEYYKFGKHIHNTFEVYHFLSGECEMDIGSKIVDCVKGDFVLIMPNTVHSFYLKDKNPCTFNHIHFSPALFERIFLNSPDGYDISLVSALVFKNNSYYMAEADEKLGTLVSDIIEKFASDTPLSKAFINIYLTEMLLHILEMSGYNHTLSKHSDSKKEYVFFALSYIHENYTSKILIDDIASSLNISSRYLSKIFFEQMNITILTYINTYRINQSIDLMINTTLSLTEIADRIGLKDSQHFSKLFRNIMGITPNKYRKMVKKE